MVDLAIQTYSPRTIRLSERLPEFNAYLKDLQREILKQEAALAARAFIKFTPPIPQGGGMGDTHAAKKQGQIAVDRDIRSLFAPLTATLRGALDPVYGGMKEFMEWRNKPLRGGKAGAILEAIHQDPIPERAFNKARNLYLNPKRPPTQTHVLDDQGEFSRVHQEQRRVYRGRITRNRGPDQAIKEFPYFAEPRQLDRYIRMQQEQVGKTQSGWVRVITGIGTVKLRGDYLMSGLKGLPKHLYKLSGEGSIRYSSSFWGRFTGLSESSFINIKNPRGNINGVGDEARTKLKVIEYRLNQIRARPYSRLLNQGIRHWNAGRKPTTTS